jgi:hypothetical protein
MPNEIAQAEPSPPCHGGQKKLNPNQHPKILPETNIR